MMRSAWSFAATSGMVVLSLVNGACGGHEGRVSVPGPSPLTVRIAKVESMTLPRLVELYGTVEAAQQTAVSSRVMAAVTRVLVKPGDKVHAGQALVEIDPQTAKGQEAQARGALAQAKAGLALAQRNFERFKALHASGSASELELDMARMQFDQASGAVTQAEGAVESASSVAKESTVSAPFAGRVVAKLVEVGDLAAPGRPLVMLESERGRGLVVAVPESVLLASSLKSGSTVGVRIDAAPTISSGVVVEMSPGADPAAHTFLVKIALEGDVPSGVVGRASVSSGSRQVLVVPGAGIMRGGSVTMAVVRDLDGKARSRAVTVGEVTSNGGVEVLSGLAAGDDVALGLAAPPADGTPLEVQP